jgi:ankyrin repeat protein
MRAKEEGADEMVDILLAHIEEKTIPELIAMGEKEELLEAMRSKPFRLSEPDSTGRVPLHYAAKLGGNDILESLLDMGAKPDAKNKEAQTPLHVVVEKGNRKGVELLLKAGADVDCTDEHGDTPLHYAAGEEQAKLVADLLEAGADPNARNNSLGRTPVHVASSKGSVSILEKLMAAGGDIHQKDASGEDALFVATRQGELRAMDLLTKRGAEPTQNSAGENLVHAATFGSEAEAVKRALELGCDINHASKSGLTPLHLAAAVYSFKDGACVETLRFLLENGADRDAKDEKGRTPIELAKPGWVRHMIKTGGKMPPEPDTNVHDPEATERAE